MDWMLASTGDDIKHFVESVFRGFVGNLPVYLACIAGAIVVVLNWARHRKASLLALVGIGVLFVGSAGLRVC